MEIMKTLTDVLRDCIAVANGVVTRDIEFVLKGVEIDPATKKFKANEIGFKLGKEEPS